ncbi:MAG: ferritin-like domain-containing protein [Chroococcidiopsidaceae cyanobacterium CP_BM_ER_R8_30]|nr:ferritin-like domain-containing protein [Chroococcidiopsidaceae cyanobacterium CP_BM_ER_R8_30]
MKIGSEAHKELFCSDFIGSYKKYEPEQLPWPDLDKTDIERLRSIPFWEEALNTEQRAGSKVIAYAKIITDPLLREAIALQGIEEERHARLFQFMIQHYGIEISESSPAELPENIEQAFIDFGYGECLDAFLGFGLFKIARQSGFLPESMFRIFDLLLHEELRHIVFFVNWVAYMQASRGRGARIFRAAHSLLYYGRAAQRLLDTVSHSADSKGKDFSATEASVFLDGFSLEMLLTECLQENARRMSCFDRRLLQPRLLPILAQITLSGLKLLPKRQPSENRLPKAETL